MKSTSKTKLPSVLFFCLLTVSFCLEQSSILLFPFKTKSLQKEEEEDWVEPYQTQVDEDSWSPPIQPVFNTTEFINKYFYNGLYIMSTINKKTIETYVNMQNSKVSIEKCDKSRIYTPSRDKGYYKPLNSDTYTKKGNDIGNDVFEVIGDLRYKNIVKIGERGNGLDFYFKENDNDQDLCGNFGFNIDTTQDKTNLINQLKKKGYINEYVWTIKYLLEDDGIIVRVLPKDSSKITLSDTKVDFLPDRGLIIGTDEFKTKIDELIFNNLKNKGICFSEEATFTEREKGTNEVYYVYYCNKDNFIGNKYTLDKTYFNSFPSLEFYVKESNMTFTLRKEHLFHEIYNRAYFLVVFKKAGNANGIWKLGEPFFSHFQFTFDQEKKILGFYNPAMPRMKNDDYLKSIQDEQNINVNNFNNKKKIAIIITISVISVLVLAVIAYFLGKKLNENRKKRANELKDDFDYSTSDSINSNESNLEKDILGLKKSNE